MPKVIGTVEFNITLTPVKCSEGDRYVRRMINQAIVGQPDCNVPNPDKPGDFILDPKLESHPRRKELAEAHWRINAGTEYILVCDISDDGILSSPRFVERP